MNSSNVGFSRLKGLRFLPDLIEILDLRFLEAIISDVWE
jgi:hypothetical protein